MQLNFNITQHIRDTMLFKFIQKWLCCGLIFEIPKEHRVNLVICNFTDIVNILIPRLNKYSLQGTKRFDLEDFIVITKLMEKKEHLTNHGLEKIRLIKSGMNTGRKHTIIDTITDVKTNLIPKTQKKTFHKVKAIKRIGPHNQDIVSYNWIIIRKMY